MATFCRPGGAETDSEDEFMFGDEDLSSSFVSPSPSKPAQNGQLSNEKRSGFGSVRINRPSQALSEDLRMAIIQDNLSAVTKILDQGLHVDTVFSTGWTGLMYAGNLARGDIFKLLLQKGANPSHHKDLFTVLMATCTSTCNKPEVLYDCVKQLIDKGVDVNAHDRYHETALICAARAGQLEITRLLLDNKAEIDRQDSRGWTALSWATQREQKAVIKLLLERGADRLKKHIDSTTAIDLANGKEIIWLFEGKNAEEIGGGDAASYSGLVTSSAVVQPAAISRTTDLRYGDLEVFLFGLQLGQFLDRFQQHQVDFPLLLTFNEEDLKEMGIMEVGVRKKLLEGIAAVHKRNWETSSLVPIRLKSEISCADAVAIIANLSKHLRYISSSVTYIKDHLQSKADFLSTCKNGSGPQQLFLHTGDGLKNVKILQREIQCLHTLLSKELASKDFSPPDFIQPRSSTKRKLRYQRLALILLGVSSVLLFAWKKNSVLQTVTATFK